MPNRLRKMRDLLEKGKCSICMDYIKTEQALLGCGHQDFCFQCILSWAKISNKCPLCMQKFLFIANLTTDEITEVEDICSEVEEEGVDDIICEMCQLGDNEESMLLCDDCNEGYHIECLDICRIPYLENWFCYKCIRSQPADVQEIQRIEIGQARQQELPLKRSRRSCRSSENRVVKVRRSERLRETN